MLMWIIGIIVVSFTLVINASVKIAKVSYINDNYTNPKQEWEKLGSPAVLSKAEIDLIKDNST